MKREWDTENTEDTAEDGSPSPLCHPPFFYPHLSAEHLPASLLLYCPHYSAIS